MNNTDHDNADLDDYDVLEDIEDSDFVFIVSGQGQLKGISWPADLADTDTVPESIEATIRFFVQSATETRPTNATLH